MKLKLKSAITVFALACSMFIATSKSWAFSDCISWHSARHVPNGTRECVNGTYHYCVDGDWKDHPAEPCND